MPGVIGGVLGAYVLTQIHADKARPFVLAYLACIGLYLIWRGRHIADVHKPARVVTPLGLIGGFLDAAGGGGWGPVVTGNLLVQGTNPRMTIGTVNAAEFVLALTVSITFFLGMGWQAFTVATAGLLIGGVVAAPLAAVVVGKTRPKTLLIAVGTLLTITSAFGIFRSLMS